MAINFFKRLFGVDEEALATKRRFSTGLENVHTRRIELQCLSTQLQQALEQVQATNVRIAQRPPSGASGEHRIDLQKETPPHGLPRARIPSHST